MEVEFSPETEAQLQLAAAHSGKTPQQFIRDTISHTLQRRAEFLQSVEEGISAANRGEFVEHKEAVRQLNQILRS